jgi:triphosphatase
MNDRPGGQTGNGSAVQPQQIGNGSALQPREIELKLELEPGSEATLLKHPLIRGRIGRSRKTVSTYYDTRKKALRDAGVSLRVRETGDGFVQTLKSRPGNSAGLFDRSEWEEPIAGPDPEVDRLLSMAPELDRPSVRNGLRPVFSTSVDRHACTIDRGDALVEVVIDTGRVTAGKTSEPVHELELELIEGSPTALFDVARELGSSVPLRLGVMTKSERGERLASRRAGRAMKAETIQLSPEMSAAEAFQMIASACIRHFRVNEALVIAARDVDALHQSRVALRRLRSAFSLFRPLLRDEATDRFRTELRDLAGTLGDARDLDVLLKRRSETLNKTTRKALITLRTKAYDRAIAALRSPRVDVLMIDLAEWLTTASFARGDETGKASRPIGEFSARILNRFWKKVRRSGKHLLHLDDEDRHELRIAGKKLRYAGEFFASLYAGETVSEQRNAFLAETQVLQDQLGALNDIVTERELRARLRAHRISLPAKTKGEDASELVADADASFRRLETIGPFWERTADGRSTDAVTLSRESSSSGISARLET